MLVLSKKSHETIVIGRSSNANSVLTITVIDVRDGSVKLGIEADAPIHQSDAFGRIFSNVPQDPATPFQQSGSAGELLLTPADAAKAGARQGN